MQTAQKGVTGKHEKIVVSKVVRTRCELDGLLQMAYGLVHLALVAQGESEVVVGQCRRLGIESDGLLIMTDGLIQPTLGAQGNPEVAVGSDIVAVDLDDVLKVADGFVHAA